MNQVTDEKKESLTKALAIAGFIAIIIFAVWLAVQVVSVLPSAFNTLASIANSVYNTNTQTELEVATENTVNNAGESFVISWTSMRTDGSYAFSYECVEGVSIEFRNSDGAIESMPCDTTLELGEATSLEVLVASEKSRFVDINYTITFTPQQDGGEEKTTHATVTIVNASIPASGVVSEEEDEEDEDAQEEETDESEVQEDTEDTATPEPTYTAGTPTTVKKFIYTVPVSNPMGDIDLQVTYLGVGTLSGKTFTKHPTIDIDKQGALQFEVKNIGTKTSEEWQYEAHLPGGITYTSDDQDELEPNERAVITLGFDGLSRTGTEKISVSIDTDDDEKRSNDDFERVIRIED